MADAYKMARQGDLLFIRIKSIPKEAKSAKEGPILAHGELTGHMHRVDTPNVDVFEINSRVLKFLKSEKEVNIRHDEHDSILLDKGEWEVRRQREYAPEGVKIVED